MTLPASALPVEAPPAFLGVAQSVTGKLWRDRLDARGAARALAIVQRYQLPEMLARVLAGRDVGIEEVEDFLDPTIRKLMPDPYTVTPNATYQIIAELPDGSIEPLLWFQNYKKEIVDAEKKRHDVDHPFLLRHPLDLPAGTVIAGVPSTDSVALLPVTGPAAQLTGKLVSPAKH